MNNHVRDEGNAFAKIAHAANWPHVVLAVHTSLLHDGLIESFNSLFVDELGLFSITVEYEGSKTTSSLLIDIQKVLTSKLEEVSRSMSLVAAYFNTLRYAIFFFSAIAEEL